MPLTSARIVLVGCGNMGGAMLAGWLGSGVPPEAVTVIDPSPVRVPPGVRLLPAVLPDIASPSALILAVKPQKLADVAPMLADLVMPHTLILSVLAAVEVASLRHVFPAARSFVRAVPNLPAAISHGVTALAGEGLDGGSRVLAEALCAPLGAVEWLEKEALCDAATSVSGCGPAFLFRFADAVAAAGEAQGLSRDQALRLVAETMIGSGMMLRAPDADPADMARRVASPGGVTLAGLKILDEGDALARLIGRTLAAAAHRSAEMAAASRPDVHQLPHGGSRRDA